MEKSIKGIEKDATTRQWSIPAKKNSKAELTFSVEAPFELQVCD